MGHEAVLKPSMMLLYKGKQKCKWASDFGFGANRCDAVILAAAAAAVAWHAYVRALTPSGKVGCQKIEFDLIPRSLCTAEAS